MTHVPRTSSVSYQQMKNSFSKISIDAWLVCIGPWLHAVQQRRARSAAIPFTPFIYYSIFDSFIHFNCKIFRLTYVHIYFNQKTSQTSALSRLCNESSYWLNNIFPHIISIGISVHPIIQRKFLSSNRNWWRSSSPKRRELLLGYSPWCASWFKKNTFAKATKFRSIIPYPSNARGRCASAIIIRKYFCNPRGNLYQSDS